METLISTQTGVVESIEVPQKNQYILDIEVYPKKGDMVHTFRTAYDRIGYFIAMEKSLDALKEISNNINSSIKVKLT